MPFKLITMLKLLEFGAFPRLSMFPDRARDLYLKNSHGSSPIVDTIRESSKLKDARATFQGRTLERKACRASVIRHLDRSVLSHHS